MMKIKSDNNVIEVSPEVFKDISKTLGSRYYESKTKGWIKVDEMDARHICNAITANLRDWVKKLENVKHDPQLFAVALEKETPTIESLIMELHSRY